MNPLSAFGFGLFLGAAFTIIVSALISYILTEFDQQRDFDR